MSNNNPKGQKRIKLAHIPDSAPCLEIEYELGRCSNVNKLSVAVTAGNWKVITGNGARVAVAVTTFVSTITGVTLAGGVPVAEAVG